MCVYLVLLGGRGGQQLIQENNMWGDTVIIQMILVHQNRCMTHEQTYGKNYTTLEQCQRLGSL